ncbi:UNKNOWN [Stylonychia lemnae]|uniref:Uncharacterized protein n=1 Tax=Stylonychia lemnae TaxID=5949 RepID=A0A078ASS1_STYLE|nr:UNKNOWN [Stylonychia lemnae]|eukprot:CDW85234.1 UNKNOWN [Stylonychia lemnae]
MKPREFNLQFMKEANQNLEINQMHHTINGPTFNGTPLGGKSTKFNKNSLQVVGSSTMQNFKIGNRYSPSKYNTGYAFPGTMSTVPPARQIPSYEKISNSTTSYLLRHQGENQSQTSFIISYKQHLKLPQQALETEDTDQFNYLNEKLMNQIKQRSQSQIENDQASYSMQNQYSQLLNQKNQYKLHQKVLSPQHTHTNSKVHLPNIMNYNSGVDQININGIGQNFNTVRHLNNNNHHLATNHFIQTKQIKKIQPSGMKQKQPSNGRIPVKTMYISPQMRSMMRNISPSVLANSTESFFNETQDSKQDITKGPRVKPSQPKDDNQNITETQRKQIVQQLILKQYSNENDDNEQGTDEYETPQVERNSVVDHTQKGSYDMEQMLFKNDKLSFQQPISKYQTSENFFKSVSPQREVNEEIIDKNNVKKGTSILSNLYRIDDRAIKFKQAKNELLKITNTYLSRHFTKQTNSRDMIRTIEENDWKFKKRAKKLGLEIDSDHSEEKYVYQGQ